MDLHDDTGTLGPILAEGLSEAGVDSGNGDAKAIAALALQGCVSGLPLRQTAYAVVIRPEPRQCPEPLHAVSDAAGLPGDFDVRLKPRRCHGERLLVPIRQPLLGIPFRTAQFPWQARMRSGRRGC